jgi:hypothetical protein
LKEYRMHGRKPQNTLLARAAATGEAVEGRVCGAVAVR